MPFSTPFTITVNAIARALNRILGPERRNNGEIISTYANADESSVLIISHTPTPNRVRHRMKFVDTKVVYDADTGLPIGKPPSATLEFVLDRPISGYTLAELRYLVAGFKAQLTDATVDALYGKES